MIKPTGSRRARKMYSNNPNNMTTTGKVDKKEKRKKLREFHQETLNKLGVAEAIFMPKMAYTPFGKSEKYVAFFLSEINTKGQDIFIEFCSKEDEPEYDNRGLYRWRFNSHFEEYEKTEPNITTGHCRYLVPIAELIKVKDYSVSPLTHQPPITFEVGKDTDLPMSQMTMRDYAAIHMKKPISTKIWLNELISQNL